jgi:hypothetical protein
LRFIQIGFTTSVSIGQIFAGEESGAPLPGRFHDVKQRRREIPPGAHGTGGTLRPRPEGPIHPIKAPVMIRSPSGRDLSYLVNRNKNVKG